MAAITSANAARTFGLYPRKGVIRPGADADLAIVDMSAAYTFRQEKMYSKAKWSPYDGMSFQGRVVEEFSPLDASEERIMYASVH